MRMQRGRRRWVVAGLIVVLALATLRLLYQPVALQSYRMLDPQALVVTGYGAATARTNLSDVTETGSTVSIRVDAFAFELGPSGALGHPLEVVVHLDAPLGDRSVIDGSTGQEIPAAPPP
ncbi:MAG: hypothetical protein ACJ77Y_07605 [Chloroflexota bacterium]